jgi:hypothetical protein
LWDSILVFEVIGLKVVGPMKVKVKLEVNPEVNLVLAISGSLWDSILVFEVIGLKVAGSLEVNLGGVKVEVKLDLILLFPL